MVLYALLIRSLYPFAPHLSSEICQNLNEKYQSLYPALFGSFDIRSTLNKVPVFEAAENKSL